MKRFGTAWAVAWVVIFAAGCNDYGNTFQSNTGALLTSLSPSNTPACVPGSTACPGFTKTPSCTPSAKATCLGFTLTVNGTGFVAKTKIQWNGSNLPTTVTIDASSGAVLSVTATVDAFLVSQPGLASINTLNPASGSGQNGLSNIVNFIVDSPPNPAPTVSSVSPTCAVVGNSVALTVTGSNFLTGSPNPAQVSTLNWILGQTQFQFNPSTSPATAISSTQITVTIPATEITPGNASVTVSNPPSPPVPNLPGSTGSGGGTSSATSVTVQSTPCPVAAKASAAAEATAVSEETPAVSLDGRYVAFTAIEDGHSQILLRDTCEGAPASGCLSQTSRLSVSSDGTAAVGDSHAPSMSADGRYVAFSADADNLVANTPPGRQIYLRDTCAGAGESCKPTTQLISTDSNGTLVGTEAILPSVSSSGRFVAFLALTPSRSASGVSSGAKGPANPINSGYRQVFVRDTCVGAAHCTPKTTRISLQPGDGLLTIGKPAGPALSGKAGHVAVVGGNATTLFMRSVPVDDRVFLAITADPR